MQWNQLRRQVPFGCHESHVTEKVLLSFNGQGPGMVSVLQFEGQPHVTVNSPVLNSRGAPIELHY